AHAVHHRRRSQLERLPVRLRHAVLPGRVRADLHQRHRRRPRDARHPLLPAGRPLARGVARGDERRPARGAVPRVAAQPDLARGRLQPV
ncbi:MAG: hypothetical protein AVDCRST_MAG11-4200, partial [uncultured Gemmatimonadaceae bacterium]